MQDRVFDFRITVEESRYLEFQNESFGNTQLEAKNVNPLVQGILLSTSRMANFSKYDGLKLFKILSLKLKSFLVKSEEFQSLTLVQQSYISKKDCQISNDFS